MGLYLTSLWNRGLRQLWNGPFRLHELIWKLEVHVIVCNTNYQWSTYVSGNKCLILQLSYSLLRISEIQTDLTDFYG